MRLMQRIRQWLAGPPPAPEPIPVEVTQLTAEAMTVRVRRARLVRQPTDALCVLFQEAPADLTLDLSEVHYIDSTGFSALLSLQRARQSRGGRLQLADLQPSVLTVMELLRLEQHFDIRATSAGRSVGHLSLVV